MSMSVVDVGGDVDIGGMRWEGKGREGKGARVEVGSGSERGGSRCKREGGREGAGQAGQAGQEGKAQKEKTGRQGRLVV
jgi:hypothetical protein